MIVSRKSSAKEEPLVKEKFVSQNSFNRLFHVLFCAFQNIFSLWGRKESKKELPNLFLLSLDLIYHHFHKECIYKGMQFHAKQMGPEYYCCFDVVSHVPLVGHP